MIIDTDRITWQHADAELHRRLLESAKRNPPGPEWFGEDEDTMTPEHTHCRDCGVCDGDTHMTGCPTWNTQRIELTVKLDAGNLERLAGRVFGLLRGLNRKADKIMATLADFEAKFAELDAATTAIATDLQSLRDQIVNGGLSADVETSVLATLDTKIAALKALASTPTP